MMNELKRLLQAELYRKSFYDFVKAFWSTCDPSKMVDGNVIKIYCEFFQYMCRAWVGYDEIKIDVPKKTDDIEIIDIRQNKNNICVMVPPRHSKSQIFNVMGPTWLWLSYPIKAASISHTAGLAAQMNMKRQMIINSDLFKELYPEIELIANTGTFLKDKRGGELYSLNRNAFTGYGGDLVVNDDLTNAETARKDREEMLNAWSYYQNTMPSRINDPTKCIIMNIQQRLAPNDIAGHIMNDAHLSSMYVFITLPAIFEKDTYVVCPISGDVILFKKGSTLWPERFGDYTSLRYQVGETIFQTQYLQHPIATDRTVLKEEMLNETDLSDTPGIENADIVYASHDFPVKDKDSSDFLGSALGYVVDGVLYITDSLEKKMAFVKSVQYVEHLDEVYPGIIQIIEDKANGSPILQQLQDKVAGMQAFQPGTASKVQRMESASLYFESKNVRLVKTVYNKMTSQWELSESMKNLKQRLLNFPFVEHDDICDAISMMVLFVFMDKRYQVYGRAFKSDNVVDSSILPGLDYTTVFFNKEGDTWKASEIAVQYGEITKLVITRETRFKAGINEGLEKLKQFAPNKSLFVDCSATEALQGMTQKEVIVERYELPDFDKSVAELNLALGNKQVLVDKTCVITKADIENFKFSKSKDENVKYVTTKDGAVANIRTALSYYGGII